jgi:carbon-monoxide dehydrogenase large subunit
VARSEQRAPETSATDADRQVGRSVERVEDEAILTGHSTYLDDIDRGDVLHGKLLRCPYGHAKIGSVDLSGALAMEGVVDAIDGHDLAAVANPYGSRRSGLETPDRTALCTDRARFMGDGVAAVVAESAYVAGDAVERIDVEYDPQEPVVGIEDALDGETVLHPELQDDDGVDGNEWGYHSVEVGDVDAAFAEADHVVEHEIETNRPTALPLEPHGVLAEYDEGEDELRVHSTTQESHSLRADLSAVLGLPENRIRVVQPPNMGGGFGHKLGLDDHEVVAAVLAMRTGRPVKIVLDRHEEFESTWCRQPQRHRIELALNDDGEFLAIRDDIVSEAGGYTGIARPGIVYASQMIAAPYWVENISVRGKCVFTSAVPSSAYRGFGYTQATLARESLVEKAAAELGFDRWELRRQNLVDGAACPTTHPMGFYLDSCGTRECLDLVDEAIDRDLLEDAPEGHVRGLGLAAAMHVSSVQRPSYTSDTGAVTIRMDADGSVTAYSDQCPMGTGTRTSLSQIVSDELGIDYRDVAFRFGDTESAPFGLGSWGSRAMVIAGSAAYEAARKLRERLLRIAAHQLSVPVEDLELADGAVYAADDPERRRTLAELAKDAHFNGHAIPDDMTAGPLLVTESFDNPAPGPLDDSGRSDPAVNYPSGVHALVVDVDTRTGLVEILDYAIADDIGNVINPMIVEGQLQGGAVQGIGMALGEELKYNESGQLVTGNLEDYRLPLISETPTINKIFEADTESERSPLGVKGVGESGTTIAPAAVLSAVNDALDEPIWTLPLSPDRVFETIDG